MMMKNGWTIVSTLWLGLCAACDVPGKSVGVETEGGTGTESGGSSATTSGGGGEGGSQSATDSQGEGDTASDSQGEDGEDGEDGTCPPDAPAFPDAAGCALTAQCDWVCEACPADACGEPCVACEDPENCGPGWTEGSCDVDGACVVEPGPQLCEAGLEDGFEAGLTVQNGCGDLWLYAGSADDTLGLVVFVPDLDVNGIVEPTVFSMLAYDAASTLEVRVGTDVTYSECNDVIGPPKPVFDEIWTATAGTIDVTITPGPGGPTADLTLNDIVLDNGAGVTAGLTTYSFAGISVGWFPG